MLRCDMGRIAETKPGILNILPAGNAVGTFRMIMSKPYASLDVALAAMGGDHSLTIRCFAADG
jgi:hypothetical protein